MCPDPRLERLPVIAGVMLAAGLLLSSSAPAAAQIPDKFENLQVLPKDIARQALVQRMREFSLSLDVRCQYRHTGGDGISFDGVDFKSDDKSAKKKARQMMKMVEEINTKLLTAVPDRVDPPVRVDCVTCHHGLAVPKTLATDARRNDHQRRRAGRGGAIPQAARGDDGSRTGTTSASGA